VACATGRPVEDRTEAIGHALLDDERIAPGRETRQLVRGEPPQRAPDGGSGFGRGEPERRKKKAKETYECVHDVPPRACVPPQVACRRDRHSDESVTVSRSPSVGGGCTCATWHPSRQRARAARGRAPGADVLQRTTPLVRSADLLGQWAARRMRQRIGACLMPPTKLDRTRSTGPASSQDASRVRSCAKAWCSSRRARCAPRQTCSPMPKPMCGF